MLKEKLLQINLVKDNDYLNKYVEIIELNSMTKKERFKTHKHHIIPKHYYKHNNLNVDNSKNNCVNLSIKDHILAHYYLIYCGIEPEFILSNIHAFNFLTKKQGHRLSIDELSKILTNAESIENIRLKCLSKLGRKNSGGKYIYKDKVVRHIPEDKLKTYLLEGWCLGNPNASSKGASNKKCVTNGKIFKRVADTELQKYLDRGWTVGLPKLSKETKQKISIGCMGHQCNTKNKIVITKNGINKFVSKEELNDYLLNDWVLGSKHKHTDEFKKSISKLKKGSIHINNGKVSKMIKENELEKYMTQGFVKGRLYGKRK